MEIKVNDLKTYYENSPKERLVTFLMNQDYTIELLEKKIAFLTGCPAFGNSDGTDGAYEQCYYNLEEKYDCNGITIDTWEKIYLQRIKRKAEYEYDF